MIKKIKIQNFRSIRDLTIEPQNLCALVGANSAGKTNVLKAIDLVLGEGWTTKAKVARELFYDTSREINIEVDFSKTLPYIDKYGNNHNVVKATLEMMVEPEFKCETRLGSDRNKELYINDDFKKSCHFIHIPSNRDLTDQMRVSNWTLLGKMMKAIYENYVKCYEDEEKLKEDFKKVMEQPKSFLEKDFAENITFKKFSATLIKYCKLNSAGMASGFEPKLDIYNLNWFYKTLQIAVKEDFPCKVFDAEEVGAGMQNLILVSIFQTYAELMGGKVILAIEEPEIYLYPQAQRELYKTFQNLSKKTQIFYTTHNPNFVDASRAYEIEILCKDKESGTYNLTKSSHVTEENAERDKFRIYTHFNTERNEIFFAKKVILVEGASDKILWTTLLEEKWGIDIDREGISIIECSGKGGVVYFIGVCKLMGITDYFAVWDQDNENPIDALNHLQTSIANGKGLQIPETLEKFLEKRFPEKDYPHFKFTDDKKVENAYSWASNVKTDEIPKEFEIVRKFVQTS